jgi:hypothetical protein
LRVEKHNLVWEGVSHTSKLGETKLAISGLVRKGQIKPPMGPIHLMNASILLAEPELDFGEAAQRYYMAIRLARKIPNLGFMELDYLTPSSTMLQSPVTILHLHQSGINLKSNSVGDQLLKDRLD